jgi:hypothetical protein
MQLDHVLIDTLMAWARAHAPYEIPPAGMEFRDIVPRRRVRLEISSELRELQCGCCEEQAIIARAYLAEPHCVALGPIHRGIEIACECGPLAETRIG